MYLSSKILRGRFVPGNITAPFNGKIGTFIYLNNRLESFKIKILSDRFEVFDSDLLAAKLKEKGINYNNSYEPLTWIFDLFRAAGTQALDLEQLGVKSLISINPATIKDEIYNELLELSEAHYQRYFKRA